MAVLSDKARAFIDRNGYAVVATLNNDGSAQQTVIWYELQGDRIMMNTKVGRLKEKNLKRDPRISFCLEDEYNYVTIRGRAELDYDPERAQASGTALAIRYKGQEAGMQMVRDTFSKEERVTVYMSIDKVDDTHL